jgi:hypothetical protein
MIWIQHDFYENFVKSIQTKDIDLSLDIFRSELSDLLTYKSKNVFGLFDKLKISYSKKASYQELVDIIINQIKTNQKFVRGLSFLIGESNEVAKKNKKEDWQKLLNNITNGINIVAKYFIDNPKRENLFKRQIKDMIGLKSSVTGNDSRELEKKDNTVLWIIGIAAVCVAGYLVYRYFDKKRQERMRLESLNPNSFPSSSPMPDTKLEVPDLTNQVTQPKPLDPSLSVPDDVLLPESPIPTANTGGVQINVSTTPTPTPTLTPTPIAQTPQSI